MSESTLLFILNFSLLDLIEFTFRIRRQYLGFTNVLEFKFRVHCGRSLIHFYDFLVSHANRYNNLRAREEEEERQTLREFINNRNSRTERSTIRRNVINSDNSDSSVQ